MRRYGFNELKGMLSVDQQIEINLSNRLTGCLNRFNCGFLNYDDEGNADC